MNSQKGSRPGLRLATGKDYDEWFALLDEWGASEREYREVAGWLMAQHGFTKWWAQKVTVEYQQARGTRTPGVRRDGTFTITVSKTVGVDAVRLFDAVASPVQRESWLPGVHLRERTSTPPRSARFDWPDDGTRVNVTITAVSEGKASVGVEHELLPDEQAAAERKDFWRDRLTALKIVLER
jgi:uncharacterized protein YndB with AHSA1/START domain